MGAAVVKPELITSREKTALAAIETASKAVQELDDRPGYVLAVNRRELLSAVHVMRGYVKQHILQRIDPTNWGDWWSMPPKSPPPQPVK